jgi:hypothetical protein
MHVDLTVYGFPSIDRLQYILRAELGDFHLERVFLVASAPLPADIVPCIIQPTTHELKSFGFSNKGFLSVGASVENSRIGRGQTLRVSVASRNDTSVDIERVRVKLVELIEYRAEEEKETIKVELQKLKDIDDLPGLIKTHAEEMAVRRSIRQGLGRNIETTHQEIYEDLVSGENQFDVVVPKNARDSYDGSLITISHYLKISFFTNALVENPSTKIPIVIGNPRDPELQDLQATRRPNEPIATIIFDEEIPTTEDNEIEIEGRSRGEEIPMANAVLLDQIQNTSLLDRPRPTTPDETIVVGADTVFPCNASEDEHSYDTQEVIHPLPPPVVPSAPHESMFKANTQQSS